MATFKTYKDFPKKGINFIDFSSYLAKPEEYNEFITIAKSLNEKFKFTHIVGIESRGFILGGMIAAALNLPFVMIRKAGKLPGKVKTVSYDLEYGSASMDIHDEPLDNVLLIDDVYATGGTINAAKALCESCGAKVLGLCLIDIGIKEVPGWLLTMYKLDETNKAEKVD